MTTRWLVEPRGSLLFAEVPTSRLERARGLRGRRPGPMLFEHARSVHTFGMREPILVAFLDRHHRVIRVTTVPPRRVVSCLRARHVLEAGTGSDLRRGDRLRTVTGPGVSR